MCSLETISSGEKVRQGCPPHSVIQCSVSFTARDRDIKNRIMRKTVTARSNREREGEGDREREIEREREREIESTNKKSF